MFDLDRREVRFRRAISTDYDGSLLEKDIKTHASRRPALDEGTVGLLRQHRLRQREEALALDVPLAHDALLFTRGGASRGGATCAPTDSTGSGRSSTSSTSVCAHPPSPTA